MNNLYTVKFVGNNARFYSLLDNAHDRYKSEIIELSFTCHEGERLFYEMICNLLKTVTIDSTMFIAQQNEKEIKLKMLSQEVKELYVAFKDNHPELFI